MLSLDPGASFGANLAGAAARIELYAFPALLLVVTALVAVRAPYVFFRYLLTRQPSDQPKTTLSEEVRR